MGLGDWPIRNGGALFRLYLVTDAAIGALTAIKPAGVVDDIGPYDQTGGSRQGNDDTAASNPARG